MCVLLSVWRRVSYVTRYRCQWRVHCLSRRTFETCSDTVKFAINVCRESHERYIMAEAGFSGSRVSKRTVAAARKGVAKARARAVGFGRKATRDEIRAFIQNEGASRGGKLNRTIPTKPRTAKQNRQAGQARARQAAAGSKRASPKRAAARAAITRKINKARKQGAAKTSR